MFARLVGRVQLTASGGRQALIEPRLQRPTLRPKNLILIAQQIERRSHDLQGRVKASAVQLALNRRFEFGGKRQFHAISIRPRPPRSSHGLFCCHFPAFHSHPTPFLFVIPQRSEGICLCLCFCSCFCSCFCFCFCSCFCSCLSLLLLRSRSEAFAPIPPIDALPVHRHILPGGILRLDQRNLSRAIPALQLRLARNCVLYVLESLEINQAINLVPRGKRARLFTTMLKYANQQIARNPDVQSPRSTGKNVDVEFERAPVHARSVDE